MVCRGVDKRTLKTWFDVLWKFEFLLQPEPGLFNLNVQKASELEISIPPQIDSRQRRLF